MRDEEARFAPSLRDAARGQSHSDDDGKQLCWRRRVRSHRGGGPVYGRSWATGRGARDVGYPPVLR
jgi:hypothetical protein